MACRSVLIAASIFLWGCSSPANDANEAVREPEPVQEPLVLEDENSRERKVTLKDIADDAEWRRQSYERLKQIN